MADLLADQPVEGVRLRCDAGPLMDGLYEALGQDLHFLTVRDGVLFGIASEPSGRVELAQELQSMGWLSWDEAGCEVLPLEPVRVSGVVRFADRDTSGHTLFGCRFGEVVDLGPDGAFELDAHIGRPCDLIVLRSSGEAFGRGPTLHLEIDGDVEGVSVEGPALDALWDPAQQAELAAMLAQMGEQQLLEVQSRPRAEGEGTLVEAWNAQNDARARDMERHLEALADPEQQSQVLLETFLGLY